ncbi:hypothetical protein Bca4012_084238 [Brassica carinata]
MQYGLGCLVLSGHDRINMTTYRSCDCFWDPTLHNFEQPWIEKRTHQPSGTLSGLGVTDTHRQEFGCLSL